MSSGRISVDGRLVVVGGSGVICDREDMTRGVHSSCGVMMLLSSGADACVAIRLSQRQGGLEDRELPEGQCYDSTRARFCRKLAIVESSKAGKVLFALDVCAGKHACQTPRRRGK